MQDQKLKKKLDLLPDLPGCYLMRDRTGQIIYVGKAKILKNRVRSYFSGSHNSKTEKLINNIADFEYIITESNVEALLLEINLIKKYSPKYNILLKDDKTYPYIKITNEPDPRLVITRKILDDKALYFGPYPNVKAANETKRILERLYPLRRCAAHRGRPCLYYQLGLCIGPCVKHVSRKEYEERIEQIVRFLKGGQKGVLDELRNKMNLAAKNMDFEKAAEFRNQISSIEITLQKQKMTSLDLLDRDVFGYAVKNGWMCVQSFFVRKGMLMEREVSIFPCYSPSNEEILSYVAQFYKGLNHVLPDEIILQDCVDSDMMRSLLKVPVIVPKRGKKRELVLLAKKNADMALEETLILENEKEQLLQ